MVCHCFGHYMLSPRILRETWFIWAEIINSVKKALLIAFSQLLRQVVLICFHSFIETLVYHNLFFEVFSRSGKLLISSLQTPNLWAQSFLISDPFPDLFPPWSALLVLMMMTTKTTFPKVFWSLLVFFSQLLGFFYLHNWVYPGLQLNMILPVLIFEPFISIPSKPFAVDWCFWRKKMCAHCFGRYWDIQQPYL